MVDINSSILRFRQQERADTLTNFNTRNEVLAVGEIAFITEFLVTVRAAVWFVSSMSA